MSIRIVTHCYAEKLPQYAVDLHYQLSSLAHHVPQVHVIHTVCCDFIDTKTQQVLAFFLEYKRIYGITLELWPMSRKNLLRRSIGRNQVALASKEELVWFCDADYYFGDGCLDSVWEVWKSFEEKPVLMWPKTVFAHREHSLGDELVKSYPGPRGLLELDISNGNFVKKHERKAIGGLQITSGDYCRAHGYLKDSRKYQTPHHRGVPFHTTEDGNFRGACAKEGKLVGIEIPNLYRIRHWENTYQPGRSPYL